jgi:Beta-galactosidase/beta-glucuronidase
MRKRNHPLSAVAATALAVTISSLNAADWKPAEAPIMTPWAEKVDPKAPHPEYPRPQLVRPEWTNLNGLWKYAIAPKDAESAPEKWDGDILVPFAIESALSGVGKRVSQDETLWYRTEFDAPKLADGQKLMLNFGGVDWQTRVFVNGKEVGSHEGGHTPFSFDITDALKADGPQELIVRVWDPTDFGSQPRGKQIHNPHGIWYTPVTGIWQTVWLEPVAKDAITAIQVVSDIDNKTATFTVKAPGDNEVKLTVLDEGKEVAQVTGKANEPLTVSLPDQKLWSPDNPFLYDLKVTYGDDAVESYFGQRKISVMKDEKGVPRMALNNEILFQYGPLDQGWWPDGLYTAPTDEALKYDLEMTKKFGFNMTRKHIKVEPLRWYYWTDKLGLLVWQDQSSFMQTGQRHQVQGGEPNDIEVTEETAAVYKRELEAMIDTLQAVPSIVVWVPFNEGWGQHDTVNTLKWTKEKDPTRLVDGPSGWEDRGWGDMKDAHIYPGPDMFPVMPDRVSVLGEFGGLGYVVKGHLWQDKNNWGYQNMPTEDALFRRYVGMVSKLSNLNNKGLGAAVYTQITDVEGEVNGLITYDRKVVKLDPDTLAKIHAKMIKGEFDVKASVIVPNSSEEPQEWSYTTEKPADDWFAVDFDDSSWKKGQGGFGSKGTPNAAIGTEWNDTKDIWLRRTVNFDPTKLTFPVFTLHFDDEVTIYVNGERVYHNTNRTLDYFDVPFPQEALKAFKPGENVIAVHCKQGVGDQYIDLGIADWDVKF